jgi:hypothetical protein
MANTANRAQKFLLDNNCGDLILNDRIGTKPEDWIYASDIMMMFLESEQGKNDTKNISKKDFEKLANNFLVKTENDDKSKMPWETKNHIPTLHNSINEFYIWLEKNYWNDEK